MADIGAIAQSPAKAVVKSDNFEWDGNGFEAGIGIAASGGGFRATLFHAGAFLRLAELRLLQQAKRISSVSGGSIATGLLGSLWSQLAADDFQSMKTVYVDAILEFCRLKIDVVDAAKGMLPGTTAAIELVKSYDDHLFKGKTLQDLPDGPRFVFCATNLQTGVLWRFSKPYAGDYVVGRIDQPTFRIAEAVAGSSAFPPVLSPLILTAKDGSFRDWPHDDRDPEPDIKSFRQKVILTDGGVYDNHGMEPIIKRLTTIFVSDGGAPFTRNAKVGDGWVDQLRRILDVTDNQVRALRRRSLIERFEAGNTIPDETTLVATHSHARFGAYWGIDTNPEKIEPENALSCSAKTAEKLSNVATRLTDLGEDISKQLVNWGYAVCDRSVRANYKRVGVAREPSFPYPEAPLS
ncbi:patatin-like phospholipase family protein [Rhizobium leguminosarum bv. viciae]|nr:patatin-like phospholipase family protein [Rhizobium leguminosarum bv. viciae]